MKAQHSLARKAALFSFFAPLAIAVLGLVLSPLTSASAAARLTCAIAGSLLISIAVVSAAYALLAIKTYGRQGILVFAVFGLLINGLLIAGTVQKARVNSTRPRVPPYTLAQMNNMLPVLENSLAIVDEDFGFRFELPAGFVENPQGKAMPNVIHAFILRSTNGNRVVVINRLGSLLEPGIPPSVLMEKQEEQLPPGSRVEAFSANWGAYEIPGVKVLLQGEQRVLEVQLPLATEAVQLNIGGPETLKDDMHGLLNDILRSFRARSSWEATQPGLPP
jgi:hypothetical protein